MHLTVLAGGIGAARFLRGLRLAAPDATIEVVANTGDDVTLYGLRVCPDLDTVMYTLAGANDEARGWGLADETWRVGEHVRAFGADGLGDVPTWFGLGDRDLATHLLRTALLRRGLPLSAVTATLCRHFDPGVTLRPMSDDPVETHVLVDDIDAPGGVADLHFQEYWVRYHAEPPVHRVEFRGVERSRPGPGVLAAIATADAVLLAPSNPVVSIGTILAVPGVRAALAATAAPVVGVSPIVAGAPVRGMADKLLPAIGVDTSAAGVAGHYGARSAGGLLDGWLVDEKDAGALPGLRAMGIRAVARPLLMTDPAAAARIARAALDVAAACGPAAADVAPGPAAGTSAVRHPAEADPGKTRPAPPAIGREPEPGPAELRITAVDGIPEIEPGADLAGLLLAAVPDLADGDVVVCSSKAVSKAEGRVVGGLTRAEAVDAEAVRLVARGGSTRIVQTRHGFVMAAAGVDASNVAPGSLVLLPLDPDASARRLRAELARRGGVRVGVIVTDTFGRPWRVGQTDLAVGAAGVRVVDDLHGAADRFGNTLLVTAPALADELASAGDLAKGKLGGRPFALVRGLPHLVTSDDGPGAGVLVRATERDLFRLGTFEAATATAGLPRGAVAADFDPAGVAGARAGIDAVRLAELVDGAVRTARGAVGTAFPASGWALSRTDPAPADRLGAAGTAPAAVLVATVAAGAAGPDYVALGAALDAALLALAVAGLDARWQPAQSTSPTLPAAGTADPVEIGRIVVTPRSDPPPGPERIAAAPGTAAPPAPR